MREIVKWTVRIAVCVAFAICATSVILRYGVALPPKVHGAIFGVFAVVFAISDRYFPNLLSGLDALRRSSSLSVLQVERLAAIIDPARRRLWVSWYLLLLLKIIATAAGAILVLDGFNDIPRLVLLSVGYTATLTSIPFAYGMYRDYRKTEALRDKVAQEETELKERKRLLKDLQNGTPHDYHADTHLAGYTKAAPTPAKH